MNQAFVCWMLFGLWLSLAVTDYRLKVSGWWSGLAPAAVCAWMAMQSP